MTESIATGADNEAARGYDGAPVSDPQAPNAASRAEAPQPKATDASLVLFDGDCNLCNHSVQFIIKRDRVGRFSFASLQSEAGQKAIAAVTDGELPDSIVLIRRGRLMVKSTAALAIARGLRFPWPLLSVFWLVPYPLRNLVYDWIARNRIKWFGKREECWVPTPELRARFLDANER